MRSWVDSANDTATDFPLENLPYGACENGICVAIGDYVLSLRICAEAGLLDGVPLETVNACDEDELNGIMAVPVSDRRALRRRLTGLLAEGQKQRESLSIALTPMRDAAMRLPVNVGDYTDFYASVFHAANVGRLFRPDNPLLPNYKYVPIGYHGRASSIVLSGTDVHRPSGQIKSAGSPEPVFAPSRSLDYELEVGMYIGRPNDMGEPVSIEEAGSQIFGYSLVNDWSARDIQSWEYQPLGPFLAKSFCTSVSPWVVPAEALEPFRAPAYERPRGDPEPLAYLRSEQDQRAGAIDLSLEAYLISAEMKKRGMGPLRLCRSNFRDLYWTPAQMAAHHSSNGCNLRTGDLLASGTVSGDSPDARGCLLELTGRGAEPVSLPTGETRAFLEDGDEVILRGFCERKGTRRIGFGECRGKITPA